MTGGIDTLFESLEYLGYGHLLAVVGVVGGNVMGTAKAISKMLTNGAGPAGRLTGAANACK